MKTDPERLRFRRASINDCELLIDYRILFLSETYGPRSPEMISELKRSLRAYFTRAFENNSFISWIAEYDEKPVGFSGLVIREQPGNFETVNGRTGYILNMFTLKEFRNNGICNMLFQKLLDEATLLGLEKVELHATNDGESVYRQFGFTEPHDKALEKIILTETY
jgi:ribosomal protein S18 acetylase RimI-like enzyme